jgi:hypothetical protein
MMMTGCSKPILRMPERLPSVIKGYKHMTLSRHGPYLVDTKIHLEKGETYSILLDRPGWRDSLSTRIGEKHFYNSAYPYHSSAAISGNLYLHFHFANYSREHTYVGVDVIVWEKGDYVRIAEFFERMKEKDPNNEVVIDALYEANRRKEISLAEAKASKEIEETRKQIQALKKGPGKEKERDRPAADQEKKQERVARLETRLAKLTETLAQLEEMKSKFEEERKKTTFLAKRLEEKEKREKELESRLDHLDNAPPVIVIASPKDESRVEINIIQLSGVAEDEKGLVRLEIFLNDKLIKKKGTDRGIRVAGGQNQRRLDFKERIPMENGVNRIKIRVIDTEGLATEKTLTLHYAEKRKNIWAVVVGINKYPHIRQLKYAVNDARLFYNHLVDFNHIPAEKVTLLLDGEATLTRLRSILGTHLKKKAGKDDMVIIFFAGHGATETDVASPDGDGLEKYLLPYDADPKDLYASALPMREVSHIFHRIGSERLVFIADSCYSGASGGRTIGISGIRANISEAFLDRIAGGKGRVIITASGANEVSTEDDELRHGVFTYYLVEGLRGDADADADGLITVDEVYRYVSERVPQRTGQAQHPVKKGTVEGRLILGITN